MKGFVSGPGHHVLGYEFRPEKYWPFLRDLSWVTLLVWTELWAGVIVSKLLARKPAASEPSKSSVVPEPVTHPAREQLPVLTH